MRTFSYGQDQMTVALALAIARGDLKGMITPEVSRQIEASRQAVLDIVAGEKQVYGINTGFGPLCTTTISAKDTQQLQYNILKSHSVGVGELVDRGNGQTHVDRQGSCTGFWLFGYLS